VAALDEVVGVVAQGLCAGCIDQQGLDAAFRLFPL